MDYKFDVFDTIMRIEKNNVITPLHTTIYYVNFLPNNLSRNPNPFQIFMFTHRFCEYYLAYSGFLEVFRMYFEYSFLQMQVFSLPPLVSL